MIVLSHFSSPAPASLTNHRAYAAAMSYKHVHVDASSATSGRHMNWLHKYASLLHQLRSADDQEAVLLLSENAAVVDPLSLELALAGQDHLLVRVSNHDLPQTDVQIWRNTPKVRQQVLDIVRKCKLGSESVQAEAMLLSTIPTVHYWSLAADHCLVMQTNGNTDPAWSRRPTFTISMDENPEKPESKSVVPRYRDVLVDHINTRRRSGLPLFSFADYPPGEVADRSQYQTGHPIALVMLYTPNIGVYARIAEHNLRQYCLKQNYTLYVHREIPAELGLNASGNWLKPWLLHGYMPHHEWVFWIDADVLIADLDRRLEPLLKGKTQVLGHDLGQWTFNSGVMGFKNTLENRTMLESLMSNIAALSDRSSVYVNNGDQYFFIHALKDAGLLDDDDVLDFFTVNTPWNLRRDDSFIVHYLGMWPEMRALMMVHDQQLMRCD